MSEELISCPFCGGGGIHKTYFYPMSDRIIHLIACEHCYCQGPMVKTKKRARKLWNKRSY